MRLSTAPERNEEQAIEVLCAALEAGVRLFDTADAYAHDDSELHHNERLLAAALAKWGGPREQILIVSKGGLTRPEGRWQPDGRATHLKRTCKKSVEALGGPIDIYLLHAPDPKTSLSTSVRALAELQREGLVRRIGLSNVNVAQIEEARAIAELAAVEVELSLLKTANILGGVVGHCLRHNIRVLAHSPLGGEKSAKKLSRRPLLKSLANKHGCAPQDVALAYLYHLDPLLTALPGATRVETARRAASPPLLEAEEIAELTEEFAVPPLTPPAVLEDSDKEVVLLMGIQAAGKSTEVDRFVSAGYIRLNRDLAGGTLKALLPKLDALLEKENARVVLDNTYATRTSRGAVLERARKHRARVRCVFLETSLEDAQLNAVARMLDKYERLLGPEEMRAVAKNDPNSFGPEVQFKFRRELEPPSAGEGFSAIEVIPFVRRSSAGGARAIFFELDGVLRESISKKRAPISVEDVVLIQAHRDKVQQAHREGFLLFGISWRPELSAKMIDDETVQAIDRRTAELLGVPMDFVYCPHGAGPVACWCRKPLPGLGALLIRLRRLDTTSSLHVGIGPADRLFANRLGLRYFEAQEYFDPPE
jgi:aryl-alcohol dehydrogenase-like predicted oxidoreductase/histidinol phosphatase-like enzyme